MRADTLEMLTDLPPGRHHEEAPALPGLLFPRATELGRLWLRIEQMDAWLARHAEMLTPAAAADRFGKLHGRVRQFGAAADRAARRRGVPVRVVLAEIGLIDSECDLSAA